MAHAWMPEARRIRAETDGGPLIGGAPRAVWLTLGTAPGAVSVQSAAQRLIGERRPCHLIWDPVTGDIAQLISVLRAGRALGAADHLDWAPGRVRAHPENVNAEGRVCVQIGVLGHPGQPFTGGTLIGIEAIVSWLDSWGVPRRWPAGRPEGYRLELPTATRHRRPAQPRARGPAAGTSARRRCPGATTRGPAPSTSTGSPARTASRSARAASRPRAPRRPCPSRVREPGPPGPPVQLSVAREPAGRAEDGVCPERSRRSCCPPRRRW